MDSALGVDRSTCIVAVGCANRFLISVFIEATGNVVARCASIGKTRFVNAAPALPSRDLGTIVCVRATVIHIVGLALICKDVLARLAFDFWWGKDDTIADVGIARRIRIAHLFENPFAPFAFRKCVFVAFPNAFGASRAALWFARASLFIARRIRIARLFENPIARFTFRKCVFVAFPSSISASGVALWVARASLIVALRIVATRFELVPFPCHAFRKRVIVAFPSAVGAIGVAHRGTRVRQSVTCRIRIARLFENPIARFAFRKCVFVAFPSTIGASGVALWVARASLFVARRIRIARLFENPIACFAFRKHIVVAFPSAVGAWRRVRRIQGLVFWRDRVGAASGEECRRSERDPIEFALFHDAISPFIQVTRSEIYKTSLPSIIWR